MDLLPASELVEAAAAGIAAARLLYVRLHERQPALLSFLLFSCADLFVLSCLDVKSASYFWFFIASTIVNWAISICVVREMFALSMNTYPGIRTAGRWMMYGAVSISALIAILATVFSGDGGLRGRSNLYYVMIADRSIVFTLAVVVAAIVLFLSRYPLHLQRNTYVSCGFFSAVFLSMAATLAIDAYAPHLFFRNVDIIQLLFAAGCFAGWAVMLRPSPAGEVMRVSFAAPHEHELLKQLDSLNNLLARSGRR